MEEERGWAILKKNIAILIVPKKNCQLVNVILTTFDSKEKNAFKWSCIFKGRNNCTCTETRRAAPEDASLTAIRFQSSLHNEDSSSSGLLRSVPCPFYLPGLSICAPDSGDAEQLPPRCRSWGSKHCRSRRPSSPLCACEECGVSERRPSFPRSGSRSSKSAPGTCQSWCWNRDALPAPRVSVAERCIGTLRHKCRRKELSAYGSLWELIGWWRPQAPGALDLQCGTSYLQSFHIHTCRMNTSIDRWPARHMQTLIPVFELREY
jgi:hypothetical protein